MEGVRKYWFGSDVKQVICSLQLHVLICAFIQYVFAFLLLQYVCVWQNIVSIFETIPLDKINYFKVLFFTKASTIRAHVIWHL